VDLSTVDDDALIGRRGDDDAGYTLRSRRPAPWRLGDLLALCRDVITPDEGDRPARTAHISVAIRSEAARPAEVVGDRHPTSMTICTGGVAGMAKYCAALR